MTQETLGNAHGGDKWGNCNSENELKKIISVGVMLVLQYTGETLAKSSMIRAQDCSKLFSARQ